MSNPEVLALHDDSQQAFSVGLAGGLTGVLQYQWRANVSGAPRVMRLMHTFVPPQLRGQGQGAVLMEAVLTEVAAMGVLVEPVCAYTKTYLLRHAPRWGHLVAV